MFLLRGDYQNEVLIRELNIDSDTTVHDFENRPAMPEDLASRYNTSASLRILFLDRQGRQLTRPACNAVDVGGVPQEVAGEKYGLVETGS